MRKPSLEMDPDLPHREARFPRLLRWLRAVSGVILFVAAWAWAASLGKSGILPGPWAVVLGIGELAQKGLLVKYVVASLFRVTWGYLIGVFLAIPVGLALGWYQRAQTALSPILQLLRPISPLAWTPLAILWFGVGDVPAVFIIFLASFLSVTFTTMNAVRNVPEMYVNAAKNFGLSPLLILRSVLFPAVLPRLVVGLRLALGIAWLVVVAAEMLAVSSGLGFLIVDARNAGNRYDLVIAGMVLIGMTGLALDAVMRRIEHLKSVRWGYVGAAETAEGKT